MKDNRPSGQSSLLSTLRLEGALFVPDMLQEIKVGRGAHQSPADYAIPKGLQLHDEYGRAYKIACAEWKSTKSEIAKVKSSREQTAKQSLAFVQTLLKECFGYTDIVRKTKPITLNEHGYPISLLACNNTVPIVVAPWDHEITAAHEDFAIENGGGHRKSPVQLLQLFLNASDTCTWGIVTNGRVIRLLRDSASLTRPCYFECDLQTILEADDLYHEFRALWHIIHASRGTPRSAKGDASSSIWELWRTSGHEQGTRVREGLRSGVTVALRALGEGFLNHPGNAALIERLHAGELSAHNYYQQLLRLIYRFIFIFTAEERDILHPADDDPEALSAQKLYRQGYALNRLTLRALRRQGYDNFNDLWIGLQIVMRGLRNGEPRLALPALGGLFDATQCPDLEDASLSNRSLLSALLALRWARVDGTLCRVDYKNMGPEELGSVYESLLELVPDVNAPLKIFRFVGDDADEASTAGNERKTTGSYYTPDCLVKELIKSALDPVIESRLAEAEEPEKALLSISVIDPAMGSGHFLLSAARRLAETLASLRAHDGAATDSDYRTALRDVISHCIYGVDRNPMAVELARTALWLEGFEPGRPLSFLDHHLVCGDALLGIMDLKQLLHGIPNEAYQPLSGDNKKLCAELAKGNSVWRKDLEKALKGEQNVLHQEEREDLTKQLAALNALPDDVPEQIVAKRAAFLAFLESARHSHPAHAANLYMAAFLLPKDTPGNADQVPTSAEIGYELTGGGDPTEQSVRSRTDAVCTKARVLHWPLVFPHVFAKGGFDCVLANPPWERIKLQEQEFFAARSPLIAQAKNKAERGKRIEWLCEGVLAANLDLSTAGPEHISRAEIAIYDEFITEKRLAEATSIFAHLDGIDGGRYPLTGVGDVNTYALFAETIEALASKTGRAGFIVPTGIATDDSTKAYFAHISQTGRIASLYDIENSRAIFQNVHRSYKFCLMTLGAVEASEFAFFLTDTNQLTDPHRRFSLKPEDFARINPNTRTCPIFRSRKDAELTSKIYANVPVLIREPQSQDDLGENPWGIEFMRMLDMSNDSYLFKDANNVSTEGDTKNRLLPLYEAKMIHQFDHRWSTYEFKDGTEATADVSDANKQNPNFTVRPRYYIEERQVLARIAHVPGAFAKAYANSDEDALLIALANWVEATESQNAGEPTGIPIQPELFQSGHQQLSLFEDGVKTSRQPLVKRYPIFTHLPAEWQSIKIQNDAHGYPLTETELKSLATEATLSSVAHTLMDTRSPRWLMGWRDICRATDERTVIASVMPRVGVGNKIPLFFFSKSISAPSAAAFLGCLCSLVHDYVARQKVGGITLNFFIAKQFSVLPPNRFTKADLAFIVPRVLELTYTTHDMRPWAETIWSERDQWQETDGTQDLPAPYSYDEPRRAQLRAELDAYYARLYGLTRDELRYILDPAEVMGPDYPTETFRGLKTKELKAYGEYRTQRLVLDAWEKINAPVAVQSHVRSTERRTSRRTYCGLVIAAVLHRSEGKVLKLDDLVSVWAALMSPDAIASALGNRADVLSWAKNYPDRITESDSFVDTLVEMIERSEISVSRDLNVRVLAAATKSEDITMDAKFALEAATALRSQDAEGRQVKFVIRFMTPQFMTDAKEGKYEYAFTG